IDDWQPESECCELLGVDVRLTHAVGLHSPTIVSPGWAVQAVVEIVRQQSVCTANADQISSIDCVTFALVHGRFSNELGAVGSVEEHISCCQPVLGNFLCYGSIDEIIPIETPILNVPHAKNGYAAGLR